MFGSCIREKSKNRESDLRGVVARAAEVHTSGVETALFPHLSWS